MSDFKIYYVCPVHSEERYQHLTTVHGPTKYIPRDGVSQENFGIFANYSDAKYHASHQVAINGGIELVILEAVEQVFAQASPVRIKRWKGDELVPV